MTKDEAQHQVLTTPEVMQILDMTRQALHQSVKNGFLPVLKEIKNGSSTIRLFWYDDVLTYKETKRQRPKETKKTDVCVKILT